MESEAPRKVPTVRMCTYLGSLTSKAFGPVMDREISIVSVYLTAVHGVSLAEILGFPSKRSSGKWVEGYMFSEALAKVKGLLEVTGNNRVSPSHRQDVERVIEWLKARVDHCAATGRKLFMRVDCSGYSSLQADVAEMKRAQASPDPRRVLAVNIAIRVFFIVLVSLGIMVIIVTLT